VNAAKKVLGLTLIGMALAASLPANARLSGNGSAALRLVAYKLASNSLATTAIDPTSALRGSLGASLGELSLGDNLGRLSLLLNGGFALLFGAFASLVVAGFRRDRINQSQHV